MHVWNMAEESESVKQYKCVCVSVCVWVGILLWQTCFPKFDGDYGHWTLLLENLFRPKECWSVIKEGYIQSKDENKDEFTEARQKNQHDMKQKDLRAKIYLFSSIDRFLNQSNKRRPLGSCRIPWRWISRKCMSKVCAAYY